VSNPPLRIALFGAGFMGRAHALAFGAAKRTFDLPAEPVLELLVDRDSASAAAAAATLGFSRSSGNWREAVSDPAVDLVAIATPNSLHAPIALAAIEAGKSVYCEKPLAGSLDEAHAMVEAARRRSCVTAVGYTYLYNPMIQVARDIIKDGTIGRVTAFRGIHAEDFMASADAPFSWRCEVSEGGGALADLGSHMISIARYLIGDIAAVSSSLNTVHESRVDADGRPRPVVVDDQADALVRFSNGAVGTISASWLASGRTMGLEFEVSGTGGSIVFSQARLNELQLFRTGSGPHNGFMTIVAGPEHGDYAAFCPAPGHQLGYNDLKAIEVKAVVEAVSGRKSLVQNFEDAFAVERVANAMRLSHKQQGWVTI